MCQEETTDAASPEKRLIIELSTVCYEANQASASAGDTKLFVSGLIFCINMVLVDSLLPFKTLLSNLVPIIAGLAAAIQIAVFLSVTDNADHALLHALIAIISISVVVVAAAFTARRAKGNSASADADCKSLSTGDDYTMATASSAASSLSSAVSSISS